MIFTFFLVVLPSPVFSVPSSYYLLQFPLLCVWGILLLFFLCKTGVFFVTLWLLNILQCLVGAFYLVLGWLVGKMGGGMGWDGMGWWNDGSLEKYERGFFALSSFESIMSQ
jgi:hypothetical protein